MVISSTVLVNNMLIKILLCLVIITGIFLGMKHFRKLDSFPVTAQPADVSGNQYDVILDHLEIPWEVVFLPDGNILITERSGKVLFVNQQSRQTFPVVRFEEAGLLGMTIHPSFSSTKYIYLYYSYQDKNGLSNKVERYLFDGTSLIKNKTIIDKIPGAANHDGGRIKFGPDGKLYITTGEIQKPLLAQDVQSLGGKVLRVNDDGTIPPDNPFHGSPVYSYGHRNPQGIAWDGLGNMWVTEHGEDGQDEINHIRPGKNYGWPLVTGDQEKSGFEKPFLSSGVGVWAPSGATVIDNKLYFTGLAGRSVYILDLSTKKLTTHFQGEFGRLRSINLGPDGSLYLITSNLDGRNKNPDPGDDRLIRINRLPAE